MNNVMHSCMLCVCVCVLAGCVRSHIDFFKSIRCTRVDYFVVEVNKLLIRLDKLLTVDSPMEDKKRKGTICVFVVIFAFLL